MTVKELRDLLANLPDNMPIGVAYLDHHTADAGYQTVDVRTPHVTNPFHKFAGVTKDVFVLEAYGEQ